MNKPVCLLLFILTLPILAQVNVEQYRDGSGGLEAKYNEFFNISTAIRRSTSSLYQIGIKYFRPFKFQKANGFLLTKVNYGETDSNPFINNSFYHLRFVSKDKFFDVQPEAFLQFENNSYSLTNQRYLAGIGVRYGEKNMTNGTSIINESYKESNGILELNNWRISQYLKMKFDLNPLNNLNITLYIQPSIVDLTNIRYYSETTYASKINDMLTYNSTLTAKFFSKSSQYDQVEYFFESGLQFKI